MFACTYIIVIDIIKKIKSIHNTFIVVNFHYWDNRELR